VKQTLVRYRTKPELADANQRLIEAVFQELQMRKPDGVRYLVLRLGDGTFVHFVATEGGSGALTSLDAFRVFQGGIKQRCLELPQSGDATIVGNYRMLDE
jgi:hypothetical protein